LVTAVAKEIGLVGGRRSELSGAFHFKPAASAPLQEGSNGCGEGLDKITQVGFQQKKM
jgi:hypothetical protein